MKKTKTKKIPEFKTIAEEAEFWDTHDITDYLSEMKPVKLKVNLSEPKEDVLAVRLQPQLKMRLANIAEEMGVNTSTLVRMWVVEKLRNRTASA